MLANSFGNSINELRNYAVNPKAKAALNFPKNEIGEIGKEIAENYKQLRATKNKIELEREKLIRLAEEQKRKEEEERKKREREEKENDPCPQVKIEIERFVLLIKTFPGCQGFQKKSCPGKHTCQENGDEEIPAVPSGMFRCYKTYNIIIAYKSLKKSIAMEIVHGNEPGKSYGQGEGGTPGEEVHVLQDAPFPGDGAVGKDDEGRKGIAHGPFGQHGKTAEDVKGEILFLPEGHHGSGEGKGEGHVRHGSLGQIEIERRREEDESRGKSCLAPRDLY